MRRVRRDGLGGRGGKGEPCRRRPWTCKVRCFFAAMARGLVLLANQRGTFRQGQGF